MALAEEIKKYRKEKKHSMNDVSKLTGIPADRIYKWEKGTKPGDAEDLLKIKDYLSGKLENYPKEKIIESITSITNDVILHELIKSNLRLVALAEEQARATAIQAEADRDRAAAEKGRVEVNNKNADNYASLIMNNKELVQIVKPIARRVPTDTKSAVESKYPADQGWRSLIGPGKKYATKAEAREALKKFDLKEK